MRQALLLVPVVKVTLPFRVSSISYLPLNLVIESLLFMAWLVRKLFSYRVTYTPYMATAMPYSLSQYWNEKESWNPLPDEG